MRRPPWTVDVGIAVFLAILVIVLSPGLAVAGLIALIVLLLVGVSVFLERRRRRGGGGRRPPRRPPVGRSWDDEPPRPRTAAERERAAEQRRRAAEARRR